MKHVALLLSLLFSAPLFAMDFGEAKSKLEQHQARVGQLERQEKNLASKIDETHQKTTQMSGQQQYAAEMKRHCEKLESTVKHHTTILEKLKKAREELHALIEDLGQHHNISSDGNGKFTIVKRENPMQPRARKSAAAQTAS